MSAVMTGVCVWRRRRKYSIQATVWYCDCFEAPRLSTELFVNVTEATWRVQSLVYRRCFMHVIRHWLRLLVAAIELFSTGNPTVKLQQLAVFF